MYQPLVDLQRGVVAGYEGLIRFSRRNDVGPERWFAAARVHGCEAELEAAALATTLAARDDLPVNTFLSVNVSAAALAATVVADVFEGQGDLRGLVLELTEHTPVDSYAELVEHLDRYRDRGALVAIDDAGSGYSGLAHLLELRPSLLKLDRSLVADIDGDEAKRILVEMLGVYAGHLDAWVTAEGVETLGELATLRELGVPLGQGWALAYPARPWAPLAEEARGELARPVGRRPEAGCQVGLLLERADTELAAEGPSVLAAMVDRPAGSFVVLVDEHGQPLGSLTPASARAGRPGPVLTVSLSTAVTDVVQRVLTRPRPHRFEPVVCTDPTGRVLGVVRVEAIAETLARAVSSRR